MRFPISDRERCIRWYQEGNKTGNRCAGGFLPIILTGSIVFRKTIIHAPTKFWIISIAMLSFVAIARKYLPRMTFPFKLPQPHVYFLRGCMSGFRSALSRLPRAGNSVLMAGAYSIGIGSAWCMMKLSGKSLPEFDNKEKKQTYWIPVKQEQMEKSSFHRLS